MTGLPRIWVYCPRRFSINTLTENPHSDIGSYISRQPKIISQQNNFYDAINASRPTHTAVLSQTKLLWKQGCQKFRAQVAANFTKSRGRQRKSSPIFPKLKMHPKCLNLGALCVKLTKNHPNGRKNNRLSNFRKLRIITFEAFRWLYMTS